MAARLSAQVDFIKTESQIKRSLKSSRRRTAMASNEDLRYQIVELPENLPFRINKVVSAGSDRERDEDR